MKKISILCAALLAMMLSVGVFAQEETADTDDLVQGTVTQDALVAITEEAPLVLAGQGASIIISSAAAEHFLAAEETVFALSVGSTDDMTGDQWEQVGGSPLYQLTVTCDGAELLGWGGEGVAVALPYDATNQGALIGWQISDQLGHSYGLEASYDETAATATVLLNESGYFCVDANPFTDITVDSDYFAAILWAEENAIVQGVGDGLFAPDHTCTRAMIATVVWRNSGEQDWGICYPYADVEGDVWYTDPVYWCTVNGIVTGYEDETFRPDEAITREQLVTMLYRYAQYLELDVSVGENTNILSYTDVFDVSEYAIPAMQWACGAGIIEGADGTLNPLRDATRTELVTMLMRLAAL